ncbi:RmlC-like cupin domain-containing protein [Ostreococcus tauri]|uniref:RmlC-like cupin domain-containing protein n=1 Tax=Ostreococcus tauri TaxID=70448 RepID=A0A1Y5IH30_OSTTA|nr:RmlC-like cupin domain-containing protein [Ostreococcus tauri]
MSSAIPLSSACGVVSPRAPVKVVLSREQGEGRGARVRRSIGNAAFPNFDPFLMLDEFKVAVPAGFPDHPHRGQSTVTYVLPESDGAMEHEDSMGNHGLLAAGDLQFMKAARGILHAEVPENERVCHGLQLWVNLPAKHKMDEPEYQELRAEELKRATKDGVEAVIIAGEAFGVSSQIRTRETPVYYVHFKMSPSSELRQPIPPGWAAFCYTLKGSANFGSGELVEAHHTVALSNGEGEDGIVVRAGPENAEFVMIAGTPCNEPIVQHGPFVMNTREEIMKAFSDFQGGKNGFESVRGWRSEIQYRTR